MIGRDDPDEVLGWIQERITCHIPNKESDPELYNLVTRYQMHKCSGYCKRKRKCGNVFITRCKFGCPRIPCGSAKLNPVTKYVTGFGKTLRMGSARDSRNTRF